MSAFKRLKKSDVFVIPYVANKSWSFTLANGNPTGSYSVLYEGKKYTGSFNLNEETTSLGEYKRLVYDSMNHMFYQSYSGSLLATHSLMLTTENYVSASEQRATSSYVSYNDDPALIKNFPSGSDQTIQVFSFSPDIYGSKIMPGSFQYSSSVSIFHDDGKGNLYRFSTHVGNIFYEQGFAIITNQSYQFHFYPVVLTFKNEHTIYESHISCTIKEHEMNLSYNPSLLQHGTGSLINAVTGSEFVPYVTTIGLYNDNSELLMVAKLAQPIPVSSETEMTFLLRYDK
jgi:hypothetical protein